MNAEKSFFCTSETEYLGYWITREGIKPMPKKIHAIMKIAELTNKKQLRGFICIVNYYRDMWIRRSHVLAPLARLTSKTVKWKWGNEESKAFRNMKKIICREVMLAFPNFSRSNVPRGDSLSSDLYSRFCFWICVVFFLLHLGSCHAYRRGMLWASTPS